MRRESTPEYAAPRTHLARAATEERQEEPLSVPSGQAVNFLELLRDEDDGSPLRRLRFIAPDLANVDFDGRMADLEYLCSEVGLPWLRSLEDGAPEGVRIVVSLSERAVPFGEAAPETVQVFEAFTVEDGRCMWEMF